MTDLVASVEANISRHRLLRKGQSVLVGVSGGVDSMVLLHVLDELTKRHRWKLTVAHFNHRLRGRSAAADERLVRRITARLGHRFFCGSDDVASAAKACGESIEMAARRLRHAFLASAARFHRIHTIALAHHADDQVELFLLRLIRGSGSDGLAGMDWSAVSPADPKVNLIRPLLGCARAELESFARERKIQFREDASNATPDHQRNRIRHKLLPLLEREYQPRVRSSILHAVEILRAEGDFVRQKATEWIEGMKFPPFAELPVAIQRRCIRSWLIGERIAPDYNLIERLRLFPDEQTSVGKGRLVTRHGEGLVFTKRDEVGEFSGKSMDLDVGGRAGTARFGGLRLCWHKARYSGGPSKSPGIGRSWEYFDADRLGGRVKLRHWRSGDRYQPIGMRHAVKLQDCFTNLKIPPERRRRLVVAESADGRLFWIEGLRIAEGFKLDKTTTHRIKWEWQRNEPLEIATDR